MIFTEMMEFSEIMEFSELKSIFHSVTDVKPHSFHSVGTFCRWFLCCFEDSSHTSADRDCDGLDRAAAEVAEAATCIASPSTTG